MKRNKGFTLIELLVVIAIIGILSSIVLASLNTARTKGADAAIKGNMNGIRPQAELYYDSNTTAPNTYGTAYSTGSGARCSLAGVGTMFNDDTNIKSAIAQAVAQSGVSGANESRCVSAATSYAVAVPLKSAPTTASWCVDSSGQSKPEGAVTGAISASGLCV